VGLACGVLEEGKVADTPCFRFFDPTMVALVHCDPPLSIGEARLTALADV